MDGVMATLLYELMIKRAEDLTSNKITWEKYKELISKDLQDCITN